MHYFYHINLLSYRTEPTQLLHNGGKKYFFFSTQLGSLARTLKIRQAKKQISEKKSRSLLAYAPCYTQEYSEISISKRRLEHEII